ncbi:hypothetical protein F2Q70_00017340 [Brassica cretica]|uniref:Uncharacterized protein n=1 Tax=Brassica cretica TaxID=69181 RepID=A0A8S9HWT5_BRACR|nr:hypothetical protein F2Q70_00017340 [Brassica cretica]
MTKKGNQIILRRSKRQKGFDATPIEERSTIRGKKKTQHTVAQGSLRQMKSIDVLQEESVDSSQGDWENDYYNPIMAVNNATPEIRDDLFDEEYRRKGILVYKFRPLKPEIQAQAETDSLLAEACGKGTRFSRISEADRRAAIDREIHESIDRANNKLIDDKHQSSIDIHPKPPSTGLVVPNDSSPESKALKGFMF